MIVICDFWGTVFRKRVQNRQWILSLNVPLFNECLGYLKVLRLADLFSYNRFASILADKKEGISVFFGVCTFLMITVLVTSVGEIKPAARDKVEEAGDVQKNIAREKRSIQRKLRALHDEERSVDESRRLSAAEKRSRIKKIRVERDRLVKKLRQLDAEAMAEEVKEEAYEEAAQGGSPQDVLKAVDDLLEDRTRRLKE